MRRAQPAGDFDAIRPEVHADDDAALEPDELGDELADNAETDDRDGVAEANVGDAHGVEGDAAERREAGVLERNRLGHLHDQVAPRVDRLTMAGALAAVGHALADLQIRYRGMLVDHDARAGVAEDGILAELRPHLGRGPHRARGLHRGPHRTQVRWVVGEIPQHAVMVDARRLRPAADERVVGLDQHVMGRHHRLRHLVDDDLVQALAKHLLHNANRAVTGRIQGGQPSRALRREPPVRQ